MPLTEQPNFLAYTVLIIWPLVGWIIYKRKPGLLGVLLILFIPYLILPYKASLSLPIPYWNKDRIIGLLIFFVLYKMKGSWLNLPNDTVTRRTIILLLLAPIFTVITNPNPLPFMSYTVPAMTWQNFLQLEFMVLFTVISPFLAGYYFVKTQADQKLVLKAFVISALIYSVPMLYEIRMSPQLQMDIYGFFGHEFDQQKRNDGFRPVVFLGHGLYVAAFFCLGTLGYLYYVKTKEKISNRLPLIATMLYMFVVLILCKSVSVMIYLIVFASIILFLPSKLRITLCKMVAILVLAYPLIRSNILPINEILALVESNMEHKLGSFKFRIDNEDILLNKAMEKSVFGWGISGRNLVYDSWGDTNSVTDGHWILTFGTLGWTGYLAIIGLCAFPIIRLNRLLQTIKADRKLIESSSILAVMLAANLLDLLPNSSFSLLTPFMAGAILGPIYSVDKKM